VCSQNHDQVGNRAQGERLSVQVPFHDLKLAAGAVAFSPFVPLLFMGEEYGEPAPFQYFTSHSDPDLIEAVRAGRKREFAAFAWQGEVPDPHDQETFARCRLDHVLRGQGEHEVLQRFYTECFRLRRELRPVGSAEKERCQVVQLGSVLALHYTLEAEQVWVLLNFSGDQAAIELPLSAGSWEGCLDSAASEWAGPGRAVPERFEAAGTFTLRLAARTVSVLARRPGPVIGAVEDL
jgi:maltooligosyltrehalose trehalohydrolase